jgi:lysylphosphatidylglycerol synthetase-like protein (DUF2156 family)
MVLPFSASQCFFFTIFAFAVVGFLRGWKKEVLSLLFILFAALLVRPGDQSFPQMMARIPAAFTYLLSGNSGNAAATTNSTSSFLGPWGPILAFVLIAAIGYYLGEKAFPKPSTPTERILGILPALVAAALVLGFLNSSNFFSRQIAISLQAPDPGQFVPILLVISILVVIGGLIAARAKKASAKK